MNVPNPNVYMPVRYLAGRSLPTYRMAFYIDKSKANLFFELRTFTELIEHKLEHEQTLPYTHTHTHLINDNPWMSCCGTCRHKERTVTLNGDSKSHNAIHLFKITWIYFAEKTTSSDRRSLSVLRNACIIFAMEAPFARY